MIAGEIMAIKYVVDIIKLDGVFTIDVAKLRGNDGARLCMLIITKIFAVMKQIIAHGTKI